MRVLGESEVTKDCLELTGHKFVRVFEHDLARLKTEESVEDKLRDLLAPVLAPGVPAPAPAPAPASANTSASAATASGGDGETGISVETEEHDLGAASAQAAEPPLTGVFAPGSAADSVQAQADRS